MDKFLGKDENLAEGLLGTADFDGMYTGTDGEVKTEVAL